MEARAVAKYIRMSPYKVRRVANLIRGKTVDQAINVLHFIPQRASTSVEKALRSAAANAVNREEGSKLNPESLTVKSVWVTEGPRMKRYSPGPMGRASLIQKRSCHLTIVVSNTKGT